VTLSHVQSKYQNNTPPARKLHRSAYLLCSIPLYSVHVQILNPAFLYENPGYGENPRRQQVKTPRKTRKSSLFTPQGLQYRIFILFIYLLVYLFINELGQEKVLYSLKRPHGLWGPSSLLIQLVQGSFLAGKVVGA